MKGPKRRPPAERFWPKVDKSAGPDGCWLWTGAISKQTGYGMFNDGDRITTAHAFAYRTEIGPVPPGLQLDHVRERGCRHRACCNPAHLEPVTPSENNRRIPRSPFCPHGHLFDERNTYRHPRTGTRTCRRCRRDGERLRRAEKKGEDPDLVVGTWPL